MSLPWCRGKSSRPGVEAGVLIGFFTSKCINLDKSFDFLESIMFLYFKFHGTLTALLHKFARATITKQHRLGGLNSKILASHISGG